MQKSLAIKIRRKRLSSASPKPQQSPASSNSVGTAYAFEPNTTVRCSEISSRQPWHPATPWAQRTHPSRTPHCL